MTTLLERPPAEVAAAATARRRRRRVRLQPQWLRAHRWLSLTVGLVLLVETTSGALLLFRQDVERWMHPHRYQVTASATPLTPVDALRLVQAGDPGFGAAEVYTYRGVLRVQDASYDHAVWVDPGTGAVNGKGDMDPYVFRLLENVHECGLTCEGYPLYVKALDTPLPWSTVTWGGLVLGSLGVGLAFLAVSGAVAWWPGRKRLASALTVRRGRGAYVRDLDLHKVVGLAAVPLLLMWGVTGSAYEFRWPVTVYYWLLPGSAPAEPAAPEAGTGPQLTLEAALATASALHPSGRLTSVGETTPADPAGTYSFAFAEGVDQYKDFDYPGSTYVVVDSHSGGVQDYRRDDGPATQQAWQNFYDGTHRGTYLPWVPRLVWLVFGLSPVLLAFTGITVWLTKRRSRRNRAAAAKARAA